MTTWDRSYLAVHISINLQDIRIWRWWSADLGYNWLNSRFRTSFNAARFRDLGGFVSSFTGASFSLNSRGCNNWSSQRTLCPVVTGLSTLRALIQPFALVNPSLRNIRMHFPVLYFLRAWRPRRMVAGFLLAWPRAFPILSLFLSWRFPIIAHFWSGMMFFLCNRTVKGSNGFQLMSGLTEEIDIFEVFVGNRVLKAHALRRSVVIPMRALSLPKLPQDPNSKASLISSSQKWSMLPDLIVKSFLSLRARSRSECPPKLDTSRCRKQSQVPKTFFGSKGIPTRRAPSSLT